MPSAAFQKGRPIMPTPTPSFPFLVDSGMGLVLGAHRTAAGVLLPEGLPAVLFHVVLGTFTFEGGDEES